MTQHTSTHRASSILVAGAMAMTAFSAGFVGDAHAQREMRNVTRTNVNRDVNVNRNVNRNVNVNVNNRGYVHDDYHPIATAAAVTATVAVTAAVVGSIARSLPPSCTAVVMNGFTYQQCGTVWYQPQYAGTQVTYVVVNPPR